jgi:acyl-coenzyme A thioesterase PaaI-like protein
VTIAAVQECETRLLEFWGCELTRVGKGRVVITGRRDALSRRERPRRPEGWCDTDLYELADTVAQWAALSIMPEGAEILDPITTESWVADEIPANADRIIATGEVIEIGEAQIETATTVTEESGKVIARTRMAVLLTARLTAKEKKRMAAP